jgi:hypothetical protein
MKRAFAFLATAMFAVLAQVAIAQTSITTITGNPLTINVGSDGSFQVFTTLVPGQGQIYPSGATGTADMGVFADLGGTLFAPAFSTHSGGTATGNISPSTAWTQTSITPVSGAGTAASPYTVTVVLDAAATGLRLTMTVTYVNGDNFFRKGLAFSSLAGSQTFNVFLGGDIYLAGADSGVPYSQSGAVGGQDCGTPPTYTILFIPVTAADRYSAQGYSTVWSEIGAGTLSNTIASGCQDNGAALQWSNRTVSTGGTVTINAATSFGAIPPIVNPVVSAAIPTLSEWGLILTALLLAFAASRVLPGRRRR